MRAQLTARTGVSLLCLALVMGALTGGASKTSAQAASRLFPETGRTVSGRFLDYWLGHGGLEIQGFPISDEMPATSFTDGKTYTVQYFERAMFEMHPENTSPNDVLLSLIGAYVYSQKYPRGSANQRVNNEPGSQLFSETGKRVGLLFLQYWQTHGGLGQLGYPISDEFTELSDLNGKPYTVQYFQRAELEYHPENAAPYSVLLSQLGTTVYKGRYAQVPTSAPTAKPTAPPAPSPSLPPASTPTAQATPGPQYRVSAFVSDPNPVQGETVTVTGKLKRNGVGVGGAAMNAIWHYKGGDHTCEAVTDRTGTAACARSVGSQPSRSSIDIDVVFTVSPGVSVTATTSLTMR